MIARVRALEFGPAPTLQRRSPIPGNVRLLGTPSAGAVSLT